MYQAAVNTENRIKTNLTFPSISGSSAMTIFSFNFNRKLMLLLLYKNVDQKNASSTSSFFLTNDRSLRKNFVRVTNVSNIPL